GSGTAQRLSQVPTNKNLRQRKRWSQGIGTALEHLSGFKIFLRHVAVHYNRFDLPKSARKCVPALQEYRYTSGDQSPRPKGKIIEVEDAENHYQDWARRSRSADVLR